MLTVRAIIEKGLLDQFMPDRTTYRSKHNQILKWIQQGLIKVVKNKGKKLIDEKEILNFKYEDNINQGEGLHPSK